MSPNNVEADDFLSCTEGTITELDIEELADDGTEIAHVDGVPTWKTRCRAIA